MPRALVLGGTGATGRAVARRLLPAGWDVVLAGRNPAGMPAGLAAAGARFVAADRSELGGPGAPPELAGESDLLVDCLCFGAAGANALLPLARRSACTVMISAKAVYADAAGRHANSAEPPDFGGPVAETQATLPPGEGSYPNGKVAAERVLLASGLPVSVLRPGLIHGVGARQPREWIFVKRALDRRPLVLLAHRGAGVNQTTAAANLAALIEVVAARPGQRILNAADPDAPSARQISRTVADYLGHEREEVLLDGPARPGRLPWDVPHPVVLDTSAATALGYRPAGDYAATVTAEVDWLVRAAAGGQDAGLLQRLEEEFRPLLDYAAEDRYLGR